MRSFGRQENARSELTPLSLLKGRRTPTEPDQSLTREQSGRDDALKAKAELDRPLLEHPICGCALFFA